MNNYGPVQVDLLTRNVRISGLTQESDNVRRLSDFLNLPESVIVLNQVTFRDREGAVLETASVAVVEKRDLVLVIPRESVEQLAQHRAQRIGIAAAGRVPLPSLLVMPPYMGKGIVNFHSQRDVYAGVAVLSPFFPLLEATILMDGRFYVKSPVVLVNRDAVAAIASQDRPATESQPGMSPPQPQARAMTSGALERFVNPAPQPTSPEVTQEDLERLRGA